MNRLVPSLTAALALTFVLPAGAQTAAQAPSATPAPPFDQDAYTHAQQLVDVGGRKLNLYCTGAGAPTVLLEPGLGGTPLDWRYVQPLVATTTRVCSYDHAGLGFSDPGPMPRTTAAIVDDLHAMLAAAKIAPPYVLVGHSQGSLTVRLFADRYRSEVAGMVLVDPSHEDQNAKLTEIDSRVNAVLAAQTAQVKACRAALGTPAFAPCAAFVPPNPSYSAALNDVQQKIVHDPKVWDTFVSEQESFDTDAAEVRAARTSYGALPLIVLTAGDRPLLPGVSDDEQRKAQAAVAALHAQLAALSTRGVDRTVAGAHHLMNLDHPQAIADAVGEVVTAARGR
ncbi:MAG: alpha/beta fold hydrolase [Candidatus Eremiobacteraeota bacterium]|nr:alpha/beta fold hydrolase [Candidatus Eremiobacteraeota bacterium]MBV9409887.1 alpha/beta fold hydrolase [Candidatus Eremiobacteraeota bacterium]